MKKTAIGILLLLPSLLFAQLNKWVPGSDNYNRSLTSIGANYSIDSKHITNRFINVYRKGSYIDVDLKDKILNKLDKNNTIGGETSVQLFFRSAADSASHRGWYVGLEHTSFLDARFTKDLFHLYFYGNKPFAGRSADIGKLRYKQLDYQQLKGGLYKIYDKGLHRSIFGIGVGYVNGQDLIQVRTGTSSLFTAADATYLDMNLSLEAQHADSANHKLGSLNGSGAALSLYYQYEKKNDFILSVQLQDLGFIQWNKNTTSIKVDTNYYFDGLEVTNLLDSVYLEVKSVDDYKNSFLKENENKKKQTLLPALAEVSFEKWLFKQRFLTGLHIRYRIGTLQIPIFQVQAHYMGYKNFFPGITIQYGGYSDLHAGVGAGILFSKNWYLEAGSDYLDGFLLNRSRGGQGVFVRIGARL